MHNSIKTRTGCCVVLVLLSVLFAPALAEQEQGAGKQQPDKGKSEWDGEGAGSSPQQCQPEKVNQLFQEIIKCQTWKRPTGPPSGFPQPGMPGGLPMAPRGYPGAPSGGRGAEEFDFLNRGGPAFLSGGGQGGGVLVSRPIPADVQPILGEGIPDGSQFFIAGPRMRPNAFPTFGGGGNGGGSGPKGGWPLIISSGPSGTPQDGPFAGGQGGGSQSSGQDGGAGQTPEDIIRSIAESFGGPSVGGQPGAGGGPGGIFNFRSTSYGGGGGFGGSPFGGPPFGGGSPFGGPPFGGGGSPSISSGPDGNTFELNFTSSGPGDVDFSEILRILKGLQQPNDPSKPDGNGSKDGSGANGPNEGSGADGAKEGSGADGAPASRAGEPQPDTTDGIIEVDTTTPLSDTTDETATATNSPPEIP